jgi:hypothetical protein
MHTYAIFRRNGWASPQLLERAAARSRRVGDEEMPDRIRWIRSYVIEDQDGSLGTVCIYEARDDAAIREHAQRAGLPADEVRRVVDTVIVRPDPVAAEARG